MPQDAPDLPCLCTALRRASRSVTAAYDEALRPAGLRVTQFGLLRTLARTGPVAVTRLAAETDLDRSTMGRNLDPLERRGLVRLSVGRRDQRERVAALTEAGEAAIAAALPHWRAIQARLAEGRAATLADQAAAIAAEAAALAAQAQASAAPDQS
ncbi:MarR family winged helix-turn-helix transcriptional regulator [Methylobacterium planeticum]|uniref:Winged helix-turn-helix transcriptional regulator n=1 Tax=Methylobacterium planeticum TaxID=2615211 RepID=A0A6N6MRF6_9HYPH|nr:MarR family winged helix-turn-helix transcriptional regulator [Methylobacterium planeticum]KAB1072759.1 winged helix-turn-helix transcriptional regulator [Methylobacterium planeticum]